MSARVAPAQVLARVIAGELRLWEAADVMLGLSVRQARSPKRALVRAHWDGTALLGTKSNIAFAAAHDAAH